MSARDSAVALLIAVLWGFNFVVMKHAVSEVPPLLLTALRFGLAALPAVFFVARPLVPWRTILFFGTFFGIVKFSLLFFAFHVGMPAGLASIVLQMHTFFTVMLAATLLSEWPGRTQVVGLTLGLAGLGVIALGELRSALLLPILLTMAAALAWAAANITAKHAGKFDPLGFSVWISLIPPLPMLALSALVEGPRAMADAVSGLSTWGILAVFYLAYPVSLVSTALWSSLIARNRAAAVVPFSLLVPILGTISGFLVYGEVPKIWMLVGGAMIMAGLAVSLAAPARTSTQ